MVLDTQKILGGSLPDSLSWLGAIVDTKGGVDMQAYAGMRINLGLGLDLAENTTIPYITGMQYDVYICHVALC